ncbi:MAG: peptidoglycan-binding protein [Candidatus Yonathbacteria bacterium]|nr:peptidoglycan-binding protein [Candidatus Yonathbacteria bacterium]
MNKIISSKSAKIAAGFVGVVAAFAFAATASAYTFTTNLKQGSKGADVKNLQMVLNMSADTQVVATGAGSPGNETSTFGPATKAAVIKFQNKYASDTLAPAGLTAGTGFVGALTRAKLNTMGGTTTTTSTVAGCTSNVGFSPTTGQSCAGSQTTATTATTATTTTSGPISVMLANDNPAASAVVAGQATADLAHFTFTGNGTLSTVKLQRTGISSNTTLSNVYLFQGNARVSDGASVDSNGVITFNNLGLVVTGSLTLSVKADIAASTGGQIVGVTLTGYTPTGATSMTTASIAGNLMSVASAGTMAGVSISGTQAAAANVNAGTMAYTFWSQSVSVTSRSVLLKGATFKYIGSATTDALANIKLYVNGTAVGTAGTINSATNLLAFDFGSAPVTLNTGASTVEVRADIMKGSSRTASFSLQNSGDLILTDSQLGVNVALSTFTASAGGTMSINAGSITTTIDPSFNSFTTVTGGATGAVIGKFKLQAYGEDVKVSSLSVTPTLTSMTPASSTINNVALYYDGAQVGSLAAGTSGTQIVFSLGSSLIVSAGTSGTLEVRADLQTAGNANYTAGTVTATLNVGTNYGQGQTSSTLVNVPTAAVATTGLTVATGALSIAQNAGYASAQTVNPNTANVKLGSYVLQNTSTSESVRVTNLAVAVSTTGVITNLSNLRTTETSGSGSTPISPALGANNFSVNFTLAPGQSKTIDVMADLGSATSTSTYSSTLLPTATGSSSNVTLTPSSATAGQTLTVQTGSVSNAPTLNPAPSSLAAQFVVGGSSNLGVAQYNFVATNGVATISELKYLVTGTSTSPITQVCVGGVCAPVVNNVAYLTGLALSVPNSSAGLNVTASATFAPVGVNGVTSNTTAVLNLTYMKYTIGGTTTSTNVGTAQAIGTYSGGPTPAAGATTALAIIASSTPKVGMVITAIGATSSPATVVAGLGTIATVTDNQNFMVTWASTTIGTPLGLISFSAVPSNTLTMVGTKPTVTITDSSDTLLNGLVKLAEITVTADAAGDVKLTALPISVTSTGAVLVASTTTSYVVKGTDGTTIASTNTSVTPGNDSVITITSGYLIPAGTSKTFRIYNTASLVSGAVNTMSLSTKLGAAASLLWNDMVGGVNGITGTLIYNYPTETSVITN